MELTGKYRDGPQESGARRAQAEPGGAEAGDATLEVVRASRTDGTGAGLAGVEGDSPDRSTRIVSFTRVKVSRYHGPTCSRRPGPAATTGGTSSICALGFFKSSPGPFRAPIVSMFTCERLETSGRSCVPRCAEPPPRRTVFSLCLFSTRKGVQLTSRDLEVSRDGPRYEWDGKTVDVAGEQCQRSRPSSRAPMRFRFLAKPERGRRMCDRFVTSLRSSLLLTVSASYSRIRTARSGCLPASGWSGLSRGNRSRT